MSAQNLYECPAMQSTLGDTLRPGGFEITKRAIEYCVFKDKDMLLDLGCGKGATIKYLKDNYNITAKGLDISHELVEEARRNTESEIIIASGEDIPFEKESFSGVLAECTLSLMDNLKKAVDEVYRVLKPGGYFVISDLYINHSEYLDELQSYSVNTCLKKPHDLKKLKSILMDRGLNILLEEKYDKYIKQLVFEIIFQHGSMENFWQGSQNSSFDGNKFQSTLSKSKLGYFLLIARKEVYDV